MNIQKYYQQQTDEIPTCKVGEGVVVCLKKDLINY